MKKSGWKQKSKKKVVASSVVSKDLIYSKKDDIKNDLQSFRDKNDQLLGSIIQDDPTLSQQ